MTFPRPTRRCPRALLAVAAMLVLGASGAHAQTASDKKTELEVYGFAMLDMGHNFTAIHPDWFDTLRVTRLPSFDGEFGEDHSTFSGVRQSRLGVRTTTPTTVGDLKTIFEFELFGTGVDSGQTTFRLRHAWGELGQFGAGQYWSPFTDPDVFPNSLEYWGPTGLAWYRNVQFRWTPVTDDHNSVMVALERPGASADQGVYSDRIELENIKPRFPVPDMTVAYKATQNWGYARVAGQLRVIKWDDMLEDQFELSGSATGWGLNFSTNLKAGKRDVIRAAFVVGEGIQNSMNDSPIDIGLQNNLQNARTPIEGKPLPLTALSLFVDHTWNAKFSSAVGYSRQDIDNTDAQAPTSFKTGQYALGNLLYSPIAGVLLGGELQWGRREMFQDPYKGDGLKLQFSFKYNFSAKVGG